MKDLGYKGITSYCSIYILVKVSRIFSTTSYIEPAHLEGQRLAESQEYPEWQLGLVGPV